MDQSTSRKRDVRLIVGAVGIAALFLALWAPVVVLAPVAGLVVDRLEARSVLLAASSAEPELAG